MYKRELHFFLESRLKFCEKVINFQNEMTKKDKIKILLDEVYSSPAEKIVHVKKTVYNYYNEV